MDWQDEDGDTPLHLAAFRDRPSIVTLLLDSNASIEIENEVSSSGWGLEEAPWCRSCSELLALDPLCLTAAASRARRRQCFADWLMLLLALACPHQGFC